MAAAIDTPERICYNKRNFYDRRNGCTMESDSSDDDHGKLTVHMDVLAYLRC